MMTSLRLTGFLFAAGVVAFMIALFAGRLPFTSNPDGMSTLKPSVQPVLRHQDTNPQLIVPESTVIDKPRRYPHNWDDNPVAYIPEATMIEKPRRYPHNWDDNPVATIPESTMVESITKADKAITLQPWDIEILMEQAINKADNGERVAPQATTLQAWDIEILMEQAINEAGNEVTSEAEAGLTQP